MRNKKEPRTYYVAIGRLPEDDNTVVKSRGKTTETKITNSLRKRIREDAGTTLTNLKKQWGDDPTIIEFLLWSNTPIHFAQADL